LTAEQLPPLLESIRDLMRDFLLENLLLKNQFMLGDKRVDLGKIRAAFFHITAK
jgi:poly(3-hydroxyalkanoate) synthetase